MLFQRTARFQGDRLKLVTLTDPEQIVATLDEIARVWGDYDASEIVPKPFVARSVIVPFSAGLSVEWPKDRKCRMQTLRKGFSVPAAVGS